MISRQARRLLGDVLDALDGGQEPYAIASPDEDARLMSWLGDNFPQVSWGRLDWEVIAGHECVAWDDKGEELALVFRSLCDRRALGNPVVAVWWSNAALPVLTMPLLTVRQHAVTLFNADFDTWIACPEAGWCIEIYHGGELCFRLTSARV